MLGERRGYGVVLLWSVVSGTTLDWLVTPVTTPATLEWGPPSPPISLPPPSPLPPSIPPPTPGNVRGWTSVLTPMALADTGAVAGVEIIPLATTNHSGATYSVASLNVSVRVESPIRHDGETQINVGLTDDAGATPGRTSMRYFVSCDNKGQAALTALSTTALSSQMHVLQQHSLCLSLPPPPYACMYCQRQACTLV
jgi:hypothetical protein